MNPPNPPAPIRKAIIPVSNLTAGMLTVGNSGAQGLLAVVDKPLIQYAIEEALVAGMAELIFVTEPLSRTQHDPFEHSDALQYELQRRQKFDLIELVLHLQAPQLASICVRQASEPGLAAAVLSARNIVRDEAFALIVAEDLLHHRPNNVLQQMLQQRAALPSPAQVTLLALERATNGTTPPHTAVAGHAMGERHPRLCHLTHINSAAPAPGQPGIVGRYLLTPAIFEHLDAGGPHPSHGLDKALTSLMQAEPVLAYEYEGQRYDCHSKLGYLQANVEFGLRDPDLRPLFGRYIEDVATRALATPLAN